MITASLKRIRGAVITGISRYFIIAIERYATWNV